MPLHPFEFLDFSVPAPELRRLMTYRNTVVVQRLFDADTSGLTHAECNDALWSMAHEEAWKQGEVRFDKLNVLNHRLPNILFEEIELQQFMAVPKEARPELFQRLVTRVCGPPVQTNALPDEWAGLEAMAAQAEVRAAWPEDVRQYVEWMEAKLVEAESKVSAGDGLELRVGNDFAAFTQNARLTLDGHRFLLSETEKADMPPSNHSMGRPRRKITLTFVEAGPV